MMNTVFKRYLSLFLVLMMCLSFIPLSAFAENEDGVAPEEEIEEIAETEEYTFVSEEEEFEAIEEEDAELSDDTVGISVSILEPEVTELTVGETLELELELTPEDAVVIWTSSDEDILNVDEDGVVTAVSAGTATVRAEAESNSEVFDELELTVVEAEPEEESAEEAEPVSKVTAAEAEEENEEEALPEEPTEVTEEISEAAGQPEEPEEEKSEGENPAEKPEDVSEEAKEENPTEKEEEPAEEAEEQPAERRFIEEAEPEPEEEAAPSYIETLEAEDEDVEAEAETAEKPLPEENMQTEEQEVIDALPDELGGRASFINAYETTSGTCGDSLTWTLDDDGLLSIDGVGVMSDYDEDPAPWNSLRNYIKTVEINSGATSIGSYAFNGCSKLTAVTIGSDVSSIGECPFNGCSALLSFSVDSDNSSYSSADGVLFTKDKTELISYPGAKEGDYEVPEGVTAIRDAAFSGSTGLTAVSIPADVTAIGKNAFYGCTGLTEGHYSGTSEQWGTLEANIKEGNDELLNVMMIASGSCGEALTWALSSSGILTVTGTGAMDDFDEDPAGWQSFADRIISAVLEEGVTSIGDAAFENCTKLETVTIPESLTDIGEGAFTGCSGLLSFTVTDSAEFAAVNGVLFNRSKTQLLCFPAGKTGRYNIPASVTGIAANAFYGSKLIEVVLPEGVTDIGENAFSGCSKITNMELPENLTGIPAGAFADCTALIDITFSGNVASVGESAFNGCSALTDVYFNGTETQWNSLEENIGDNNKPLMDAAKHYNYTVIFNANGGTGAPEKQIKINNLDLTLSSTEPTREGYTFKGWATTDSATSAQYQAGGTYTANADITLYAVWKINTYTVTYDANGGAGAPADQTKTHKADLTLSDTEPTREGHSFRGWATTAEATAADYQPKDTYTEDKDITLYAVWKINTYTVSYDANGGEGAPEDQTKTYDVDLKLSETEPTRAGYTFQGWANTASATAAQYPAGSDYTANADITLYAVWKINTYTVTYDANGGTGAPADQTKTHKVDLKLSDTEPARVGYDFIGWATDKTAATAQYQPEDNYTADADVTMYAVWESLYPITGTCGAEGADITWTLTEEGVLTVSGTGETADYSTAESAPWYDYRSVISSVEIESGVTGIGEYAFYNCDKIESVTIPETVTGIGDSAFRDCTGIKDVFYNDTEANWNALKVDIESNNTLLLSAAIHTNPDVPELSISKSAGKIKLSWNAVPDATKYLIYRSTDGENFTELASEAGTAYTDSSVESGTMYYYKIKAVVTVGETDMEGECSAEKHTVPLTTPTLSVSRSDGKVKLSWEAVTGATKYWVYRSTDGTSFSYYGATTGTTYTNSSVKSGTKYWYKVKAISTVDGTNYVSNYSAKKSTVPLTTPKLSVSANEGKVTLSWEAVTGATKYWVYRSTDGTSFTHYGTTANTTYTNSSVTSGTQYWYKIRAVATIDGTDWGSDYSEAKSVVPLKTPALSISRSDGAVKLSWNAVTGATKYWVYRSTDGTNFTHYGTTANTTYTNSSVTSGTKYWYKIKAVAAIDGTNWASDFSTAKSTVPVKTPKLSFSIGSGKVKLSWNAVTGATKYWIYRSNDGENFSYLTSTAGTTYTASASAGKQYCYKIKAIAVIDGTNWGSDYSEVKGGMLLTAPTMSLERIDGTIKLSWNTITGAEKYQVYRSTDGVNFTCIASVSETEYTDDSVISGTKYWFKIKAAATVAGTDWESAYSNVKNAIPMATPKLSVANNKGTIKLSWAAINGATYYQVYRSTDGVTFIYQTSVYETYYYDTSAQKDTRYYYRIKATVDVNGTNWVSDYSEVRSGISLSVPTLKAAKSDGEIKLSWGAGASSAKYWIYRSSDGKSYTKLTTVSGTSFKDTSAVAGKGYFYKIKEVVTIDGTNWSSEYSNIQYAG